jgi:hypothetical protein
MIVLIDTNSLLALVRYYLPFDSQGRLLTYFKEKIISKEIMILDKVYEESTHVAKGIIVQKLSILKDKKIPIKTNDLLPDTGYFNLLENAFCNEVMKSKLTVPE